MAGIPDFPELTAGDVFRCPVCDGETVRADTKVRRSGFVWRRRKCTDATCAGRVTTYERVRAEPCLAS